MKQKILLSISAAISAMLLALSCGCSDPTYSCLMSSKYLINDFDDVRSDYQLVADALMEYRADVSGGDPAFTLSFVLELDRDTGSHHLGCFETGADLLTDGAEHTAFQRVCASFDNDSPLEYIDVTAERIRFVNRHGIFAVIYRADGSRPDPQADSFRGSKSIRRIIAEDRCWYQALIC